MAGQVQQKAKLIAAADRFALRGKYRRAIAEYKKLLKLDPDDLRAQLKLADLHARAGDTEAATDAFSSVAEHYTQAHKYLKATAVFKKLIELSPTEPAAYVALADSYRGQGLQNDAAAQYREAIALYVYYGDEPKALDTVRKLLELDPDNVGGRVRLAEAYSTQGRIDEAAEEFRLACQTLRRAGKTDDFIRCAERLLYHDPEDFDACRELASLYIEADYPQKALPKLHRAFKMRPRDTEVLDLLASVFEQLNQSHKAVVVLKALAQLYEASGLKKESREVMSRVFELNPDDADARALFRSDRAPKVSTEIQFEEPPHDPRRTAAPAPRPVDEEPGFEEAPSAGGGPAAPVEMSLTGMRVDDITELADTSLVSSLPVVEPIDDETSEPGAEEVPFDLDPLEAEVVSSPGAVAAESAARAPEPQPPEPQPPEPQATAPAAAESAPPHGAGRWDPDDDRTLVDDPLPLDVEALKEATERYVKELATKGRSGVGSKVNTAANAGGAAKRADAEGSIPEPQPDFDHTVVTELDESLEIALEAENRGPAALLPERLASDLEELDFFLEQGLFDEATTILKELMAVFPSHPELSLRAVRLQHARRTKSEPPSPAENS